MFSLFSTNYWFRAYSEKADASHSETALQFSLTCPHETLVNQQAVASVNIPAIAGEICVLGGTGATITELNAGLVTVKTLAGETSQYFISPGFALKGKDRTLVVSVAEAVPLEELDPAAVDKVWKYLIYFFQRRPIFFLLIFFLKKGLEFWTQKRDSAPDEEQKSRAWIGVLVHQAMQNALKK